MKKIKLSDIQKLDPEFKIKNFAECLTLAMMKAPKDGAVCALAGFFEILHQPDHPEVQKLRDLHKNLQKLLVMENGKD